MQLKYLLMPLIGGLIGWITNALAIWMLFHPYHEKKFLGLRVPFTPGLIPSKGEGPGGGGGFNCQGASFYRRRGGGPLESPQSGKN